MKTTTLALASLVLAAASTVASAQYANDFSNPATAANFAADRANPGGFVISDGTLKVNVTTADPFGTSGFYDFHGIQTGPVGEFNAPRGSTLSVDLFVPTVWDAAALVRAGDLWARIDELTADAGNDFYPSIGVYNIGDGRGALVSLFSPTTGGFDGNPLTDDAILDLPDVAINFEAFNTLALRYTATGVDYLFNGTVVATDNDLGYLTTTGLDQAFLQGFQGDDNYVATFDNLNVVVPEPTTLAAIAGAGVLGLRRRRA